MEVIAVFLAICFASGWAAYVGRFPRFGVFGGLLLGAAGALAAYDGSTRAWREYASTHDGRVTPGVVIALAGPPKPSKKWESSRTQQQRQLRALTTEGTRLHDVLGRLILTGSSDPWTVEYRYDCERPNPCRGRDIVPEDLWGQLHPDQVVDVRMANGNAEWSRLDGNPQSGTALADLTIALALLTAAAGVSGLLTRRGPRYVTVPAVVTAIEPARTGDEPSWRITFAYVDAKGNTYEATDEVIAARWKQGDEGLAVFPPGSPDLATFQPLGSA